MTSEAVLSRIASALNSAGIPFMLTGSFAAAYHGAVRATMDIDLVIDPTTTQLQHLVEQLRLGGQYVSLEAALEAMQTRGLFNVIDPESGWKVDLILRKDRAFSREEFERRIPITIGDIALHVTSREDVILSKLEWARLGSSARQLEDVVAILRIGEGELDMEYLLRWITNLGVRKEWEFVRTEAER